MIVSSIKNVGRKWDLYIKELEYKLINLYQIHKLTQNGLTISHEIARILKAISVEYFWH